MSCAVILKVESCVVKSVQAGLLYSMIFFQVSGKDVAYGLTCTMLLLAAVTVLRESDKMPGRCLPTIHSTNHYCGTSSVKSSFHFLIQFLIQYYIF
jgi:hypothetical protein